MMGKKTPLVLLLLALLPCLSLGAVDFGIVLDQRVGYGGYSGLENNHVDYSGSIISRFSVLLGTIGSFYISAGAGADFPSEAWQPKSKLMVVPELLRTEVSLNFGNGNLLFGRMYYSDPLGFIADGLFDGIQFSYESAMGTLSVGAWYTGLLYKKRANIAMTIEEVQFHRGDADYTQFADTYFAPRRLVSAVGWAHPSLGERIRLKLALLGQFDLPDDRMNQFVLFGNEAGRLHSQYLALKLTIPAGVFVFDLGGCFEFLQFSGSGEGTTGIAMAGDLGISLVPTMGSQLSLLGRYSSGRADDNDSRLYAFGPLTAVQQGNIFREKLSGLSMISLDFFARLHQMIAVNLNAACFMRSDLGTYSGYLATGEKTYFLGTEVSGRLFWSLLSDVQFTIGGGAFLPLLGNVARDANMLWRVEFNFILSVL